MTYIEVIVPLPLNALFTYSVPEPLKERIAVGSRVIVPFGLRKRYTAIVVSLTAVQPEGFTAKPIEAILDDSPVLLHPQLKFWQWMADYYMSAIGDVMRAALPAGLKVESETFLETAPELDFEATPLSAEEAMVVQVLMHNGRMMTSELGKKAGLGKDAERVVSRMIERNLLIVSEKIVERYRTLKETMVALPPEAASPGWRASAFAAVKGAPRQENLLLAAMQLLNRGQEVSKARLMDASGCSAAIVKILSDKGLLHVYKKEINRFHAAQADPTAPLPTLSASQAAALDSIEEQWHSRQLPTVLLRGVTSSGKTEVYITLIDRALKRGEQVLYLVPEIALTTQLTERLQRVFGSKVVVYHSKFTDNERVDIWRRMLTDNTPYVVIGARSSVFLPFHRLGLAIIDEEHEQSYKQFDPAPRYNARDSAIMLASLHGAKVLLGSATPSVETFSKALDHKYGLAELTERYGGVSLPHIDVVDMTREFKRQGGVHQLIADDTQEAVSTALSAGNQAIVFHNRRGFAPMARCKQCAHVAKCADCDVSLTYHREENRLVCHYCGASYPLPTTCPVCHEPAIEIVGYGTERVEERVQQTFPASRILRMDLDSTRNKDGYQEIINNFSARKSDILVGTQMVTKGLDFDAVSVVAVLSADMLIHYPDFRSSERAFNMLMQVAGRAGRRDTAGKVIVQTSEPKHPVITFLTAHDYRGFFEHELAERRRHLYPPFTRLIYIYLKHQNEETVAIAAEKFTHKLIELLGNRVFGPEKPAVGRVQQLHIRKIMLKIETGASMQKVKNLLRTLQANLLPSFKGVTIHYDVDPM